MSGACGSQAVVRSVISLRKTRARRSTRRRHRVTLNEVCVNSVSTNRRFHWILISVLLLIGIFPASIASRHAKGFHVVQRAACRAIGAHDSLSAATTRIKRPSQTRAVGFILIALLLNLFAIKLSRAGRVYRLILRFRCSSLWPPSLLFRPPPVSAIA